MLSQYIRAAMGRARYEMIEDAAPYYGEVPECQGVWATGTTPDQCRAELQSALEDWILFRLSRQLPLPVIEGLDLTVRDVA
jgi:predicted RNase H-like HicB family nuclease